jgi:geranylgeranyl pyrophosphate synthase
MPLRLSLSQFIDQVREECLTALWSNRFCDDQKALLQATMEQLFNASAPSDWGQPLGLYYAIYRICGEQQDEVAQHLAQFAAFYIASADLFDDVQDEDLEGKPHERAGTAIATNSALTLLTLALDALGKASELESRMDRRLRYLRLFNRVSLIAVAAQHQDLLGCAGACTRSEVEHMHRGKTSSIALVSECAALAGGADVKTAEIFYQIGEELAAAVQVIDDVRDLVANEQSVDLKTGKWTYPLACFAETATAEERECVEGLLAGEPIDQDALTTLLEQSGAFDACASAVESHRSRIATLLDEAGASGPHRRLLGEIVDHLASTLYDPPTQSCASEDEASRGRASQCGQSADIWSVARAFKNALQTYGFGPLPEMRLWHLPMYLYAPERAQIFISDLEGIPEEIIPFHREMLGLSAEETALWMARCAPFLLSHELVHAWRDQLGVLSEHAWHEEYIANRVALSYVQEFHPESARAVVHVSRLMLARQHDQATAPSRRSLLKQAARPGPVRDYNCTPQDAALLHAEMICEFSQDPKDLAHWLARWLQQPSPVAAE